MRTSLCGIGRMSGGAPDLSNVRRLAYERQVKGWKGEIGTGSRETNLEQAEDPEGGSSSIGPRR